MGTTGYGTESSRKLYHIKGYELFMSCCVNLGKLFNISEPQFLQLLSENFRKTYLQDHVSSNMYYLMNHQRASPFNFSEQPKVR